MIPCIDGRVSGKPQAHHVAFLRKTLRDIHEENEGHLGSKHMIFNAVCYLQSQQENRVEINEMANLCVSVDAAAHPVFNRDA
jgi:hypothetical protein